MGTITPGTGTQASESERAAAAALLPMIWGIHISRAVYLVAELGIADLLAAGPMSSTELARATDTDEPSLYRVLRLLAALGVFDESPARSFSLTEIGERLREGVPAGMRSWARLVDALGGVEPFGHIIETVRTGKPGRQIAFGNEIFFELDSPDPRARAIFDVEAFNSAMSERTAAYAPSVPRSYDFSDIRRLVDIGGGQGVLLVEILRHHVNLRGVLFEVPAVAADARPVRDASDLVDRCEVVTGDFFHRVPDGADCYLMANVLHDWDDARAIQILRNCRASMAPGGRVLIVERLIPDHPGDAVPTLLSDINMLVLTGGRERTNAEYGELLAAAGLKLQGVTPVAAPYGVIDGRVA
jgi:hypothetical protein